MADTNLHDALNAFANAANARTQAPPSDRLVRRRGIVDARQGVLKAVDAQHAHLFNVIEQCKATFDRYAVNHRNKHTPDGDEKAKANERMSQLCAVALEGKQHD